MDVAAGAMNFSSIAGSSFFSGFGSKKKVCSAPSRAALSGDQKILHPGVSAGERYTEYGAASREQFMPAVQKLYDACKKAFGGGGTPTPQALERVRTILDRMKASDVGLEDNADAAGEIERGIGMLGVNGRKKKPAPVVPRLSPPITYLELYDCDDFSMGIFCLPVSAALPLHNHPGMTVFSKVLYGSMHVKSYDWVNPVEEKRNGQHPQPRLAKLVEDQVLTSPCDTEVLYPLSCNIHAFRAVTACAVLDVLAPPYDASKGRHCTYFREVPSDGIEGDCPSEKSHENGLAGEKGVPSTTATAWLEEFRPPDDFVVQRGVYRGPKVLDYECSRAEAERAEIRAELELERDRKRRRRGVARARLCAGGLSMLMARRFMEQPISVASMCMSNVCSGKGREREREAEREMEMGDRKRECNRRGGLSNSRCVVNKDAEEYATWK